MTSPPPPRSTLFPYTTLFRSQVLPEPEQPRRIVQGEHGLQAVIRDQLQRPIERLDRGKRFALEPLRSEEHTSELQSLTNLVCRLLLEKKKRFQQDDEETDHKY